MIRECFSFLLILPFRAGIRGMVGVVEETDVEMCPLIGMNSVAHGV